MPQRYFHDDQIRTLKETVRYVFWTKRELRSLFERCGVSASILGKTNFDDVTWNIVDGVLEALNASTTGIGALRKIADETLRYKDGSHLNWAGEDRVSNATAALKKLREVIGEQEEEIARRQRAQASREASQLAAQKNLTFGARLDALRTDYLALFMGSDPNKRGFALEKILNSLFDLFDLASSGSFRRKGEQLDGACRLDQKNCLVEAKWQKIPVNVADLRDLDCAVGTTLETTLGIFISIEGFSPDGLEAYLLGNRPKLICIDGSDIMLVLEGRIRLDDLLRRRLDDLLRRKLDLASERRLISVSANDILAGKY